MAVFVVDASIALALVLPEEHTEAARSFFISLTSSDTLLSPAFLLVECASVLREKVFNQVLSPGAAEAALAILLSLDVEPVVRKDQHGLALRIASQRGQRVAYDAHYVAVARLERAELVTADAGMYQGAVNLKIPARLLR